MHHVYLWLFSIPCLSILIIGLYQNLDEIFKKNFVLERRKGPNGQKPAGGPRRRYSDSVPSGTLPHPETATSETVNEAPVAQSHTI